MTRRVHARALAAACAALTLAACSADPPTTTPTDGATPPPASQSDRGSDGTLRIGYVLSETGPLSGLGVGVIAAVRLAVKDINEAGGALGKEVELVGGDEAGDPTIAGQTVDRLLGDRVDAVIGPVSSAISLSVIDKITGAGAIQCAGANTSKTFTTYNDRGMYFRTIPANIKQGPVLAQAVIADGASRVALVVRNDDYGKSLSDSLRENLQREGAEIVADISYDPAATTYSAEVAKVKAVKPDAVVVVAFQEGAIILRGLIENQLGPDQVKLFGTDGMSFGALAATVDKGSPDALDGMQGTQSSSQYDPAFLERLKKSDNKVKITNFAPYHYDCVITIALAALAANTDAPGDIATHMVKVTRDGEKCRSFADCARLLKDGKDIDYDGVSGPLDFTDVGEPQVGLFDVIRFDNAGIPQIQKTVESRG